MTEFSTVASREFREVVVTLTPPIFFLALLIPIQRLALGANPLAFLLIYEMLLVFLYLLLRRMIGYLTESFKLYEQERIPEESSYSQESVWEVIRDFHGVRSSRDPITAYSSQPSRSKLIYSVLAFLWSIIAWLVLATCFAVLIWLDIYQILINRIKETEALSILYGIFEGVGGVFISLAQELFPGMDLENGIIVLSMIIIPGFIFLTAASNLAKVLENYNKLAIKHFYKQGSMLRSEGLGAFFLLILYIGLFHLSMIMFN